MLTMDRFLINRGWVDGGGGGGFKQLPIKGTIVNYNNHSFTTTKTVHIYVSNNYLTLPNNIQQNT